MSWRSGGRSIFGLYAENSWTGIVLTSAPRRDRPTPMNEIRTAPQPDPLLVSQRRHRIDSRSAPCGQVSGQQRATDQDGYRDAKRERIVGLDAKEEGLHEGRGFIGGNESDRESESGKRDDFTQHHPD